MSTVGDIRLLSWVVDKLHEHKRKNKEQTNEAIASIHAAWSATYNYLRNEDGKYIPNEKLSNLWNEAARCTRLINAGLASQLQDKSRFWIHPELPRQNRILKLTEIMDEVERLNKKFIKKN
ncbi:hypothetical protein [Fulvivirga sediminis]|uniref:Uncharacterized protein n=1 Tax=Fulvivirga sediminis TaxID=2803949 RepID=A0A937F8S9_9BACT|nr:hypothetical protein [Fulvivirga sediminis]MBL3658577.1 hypothetical protein [Fulvivirga sediminis]